ncbi:putative GTP-binding protein EngB [Bienertia sinuspersici]
MATKLGNLAPTSCFSFTSINNTKKLVTTTKTPSRTRTLNYPHEIPQFHTTPLIPVVRASSGPNSPEPSSPTKPHNSVPPPTLQEDLIYLLKLAGGSFLGSALVKYGSAILPDITRPNLTLALLMISTPVAIAVLLLFNGSRKD